MEYNYLGSSGLRVSPLCLGAMMFGGPTGEAAAAKIVAAARDAGINFIDTANNYNAGESERIVGKLIRRRRDHWVLATKGGNATGPGPMERGNSRRNVIAAIDASLKRLGTDYIDIWYFHVDDHQVPLEESIGAVGDAVAAGKLRYWGVSNFSGWRIALAASLAEAMGAPPPAACQPYYNAMNRMPEHEVLPACDYLGLGVVPYSPLARGVLTGKYGKSLRAPKSGTRAARNDPRLMETEWRQENLDMAQIIKRHAEARGMTAGDFAVNWVLNNALVTSVLAGPRTLGHWKAYMGALKHDFTAEDEALIDSLVPAGHPSTPGYSDPKYPLTGRQPWTG